MALRKIKQLAWKMEYKMPKN